MTSYLTETCLLLVNEKQKCRAKHESIARHEKEKESDNPVLFIIYFDRPPDFGLHWKIVYDFMY